MPYKKSKMYQSEKKQFTEKENKVDNEDEGPGRAKKTSC